MAKTVGVLLLWLMVTVTHVIMICRLHTLFHPGVQVKSSTSAMASRQRLQARLASSAHQQALAGLWNRNGDSEAGIRGVECA